MAKGRRKQRGRTASAGAGAARSSGKPPATEPAAPARFAERVAASRYFLPALLFAVCFGAYVSNGDFLPGGDQEGNMLFSVNLLKRGSLSLGPLDAPHAFSWTLEQPGVAPRPVAVDNWNSAADAAYRQGQLKSLCPTTTWPRPRAPTSTSTPSAWARRCSGCRGTRCSTCSWSWRATASGGGTAAP